LLRVIVDLGLSSPDVGSVLLGKKLPKDRGGVGVNALKGEDIAKSKLRNAQNLFSRGAQDAALG